MVVGAAAVINARRFVSFVRETVREEEKKNISFTVLKMKIYINIVKISLRTIRFTTAITQHLNKLRHDKTTEYPNNTYIYIPVHHT